MVIIDDPGVREKAAAMNEVWCDIVQSAVVDTLGAQYEREIDILRSIGLKREAREMKKPNTLNIYIVVDTDKQGRIGDALQPLGVHLEQIREPVSFNGGTTWYRFYAPLEEFPKLLPLMSNPDFRRIEICAENY